VKHRFLSLTIFLPCLLVLVACSARGTTPSDPVQGSNGVPFASGNDQAPSASGELPSGVVASADPSPSTKDPFGSTDQPSAADALENLLPDQIGGQPVRKGSMPGDRFVTSGLATPDLGDYLIRLGVHPQAILVSFAYTVAGPKGTGVFAFEVKGASQDDLMRAVTDGRQPEIRGSVAWQSKVVGGKPTVTAADETWAGGNSVYRYAAGNVVFFITAGHESTAAEILASLP
jgi:hypothetical protein